MPIDQLVTSVSHLLAGLCLGMVLRDVRDGVRAGRDQEDTDRAAHPTPPASE